jgi:4-hydroxymandelate oxidase
MTDRLGQGHYRREFLKYLAASPLYGAVAATGIAHEVSEEGEVIDDLAKALDVFDLKATARAKLPPAHYGYLATGTFDDKTLHANRAAFDHYYLRSRRLIDVLNIDTSVEIFGEKWPSPIVLCPAGSQQAYNADGELATARAARSRNHLQILSTVTSFPIEAVVEARGAPVWYQLYTSGGWDGVRRTLRRVEAAGSPALVVTVDLPAGSPSRNTMQRWIQKDTRDCDSCHSGNGMVARTKPMLEGSGPNDIGRLALTWDFLRRLRDETTMKILVKGIVTAEDADLCVDLGVDGIIVSNHGGRADNSGRGAIDSLAEVAGVARGRTTVLMDSGIRRGTDILTALALGADAVCVGRPYLWGLGAFGQAGVERALEMMQNELIAAMQFAGTATIKDIGPGAIGAAGVAL